MSRDEHRQKCIEAMARRIKKLRLAREPGMDRVAIALNCDPIRKEIAEAEMWLDSLHGLARVVPIDATAKMDAAAGGGDLANPPVGGQAATMQGPRPNLPEPKGWENK